MSNPLKSFQLTQLSSIEHEAVESFSRSIVARFGSRIATISAHGTRGAGFRQSREINLLVLLKRSSESLESSILEEALLQLVETGVYLTVRCFSRKQYDTFRKMELPMIEELQRDAISLWAA